MMADLSAPEGEISVAGYDFLKSSVEVARLWVQHEGPGHFIINAHRLEDPAMFGMMLVDCLRHAAKAYAFANDASEGEMLERIWEGLDAERERHTTPIRTIREGTGELN